MTAYANNGDCAGVDNTMLRYLSLNFVPTARIGNTVLKSLASTNSRDEFTKFYKAYKSLFGPDKLKPDTVTYTILFEACLDGGHTDIAKSEYAAVRESGFKLTKELHDIYWDIIGYEKGRNYGLNHKNLWGVTPKKLSPMEVFRRSADYENGLARMRDNGDYNDSLRHFADVGDVSSVRKLIVEMESRRYAIDMEVMNSLISAYANKGDLAGAEKVISELGTKQLSPNYSTMRILIRSCSYHGDPSGAEKILQRAMKMGMHTGCTLLYINSSTLIFLCLEYIELSVC